uniref:Small nuclear ribonucleoprotein E n=1 Tax=Amphiprion ocellaris TaxID=80972 RepID=A0AAQ5ZH53_AMPOC
MAYRGQGQKVQKVMVQPINLIFRYLQNRSRIQVWLYEQVNMRIEGCIIGFDEYMNLVLDDAEEVHMKTKNRKPLGHAGSQVVLNGPMPPLPSLSTTNPNKV